MSEKDEQRAKDQARAQLNDIVTMMSRLKHADECDGDGCELTDKEIMEGLDLFYKEGEAASEEQRHEYHDRDAVEELLNEDPLSVEVRSDWYTPGSEDNKPTEYNILLCTGGPAVRIIGDLDEHGQPTSAQIEYQDWFTPWVKYSETTSEEDECLLAYASHFYFGE